MKSVKVAAYMAKRLITVAPHTSVVAAMGLMLEHKISGKFFRTQMQAAGFTLAGKDHPIIPVMIGDATLAGEFSKRLLAKGIYAVAFSYPVVPKGQARIRTQMSAALSVEQLRTAVAAFTEIGHELGILSR